MQMIYVYGFADAAHGSVYQERHLDNIANNLANADTPGFKADRLVFNEFMDRQMRTDFQQGSLRQTDNPLDVAIAGEGFFQVRTPQGMRLTRDGSFHLTQEGTLVTENGYPVVSAGGAPITINPDGPKVSINDAGQVYQGEDLLGQIGVVNVADPQALDKEGANLFTDDQGRPPATVPANDFILNQGFVEQSNVAVVKEMTQMIAAYRGYESYQKALHAMQQMDSKCATELGRVA